jgi:hypothetical protein
MLIVPHKRPLLWTRGVAARETLSYLDRREIDAEPALFGAGLSRRQLSQNDIGVSVASQAPQAWLADVLARIADHPASRLAELLPWN